MDGRGPGDTVAAGDPFAVLGVDPNAGDGEIRAAYLARIRRHPPDRSPLAFERIRDAYQALRDPTRRAGWRLFGVEPQAPLLGLLEGAAVERRFVGPGPWLALLRRRLLEGADGDRGR